MFWEKCTEYTEMHCNILGISKYAFGRFVLKCTAYSPNVPHIRRMYRTSAKEMPCRREAGTFML